MVTSWCNVNAPLDFLELSVSSFRLVRRWSDISEIRVSPW